VRKAQGKRYRFKNLNRPKGAVGAPDHPYDEPYLDHVQIQPLPIRPVTICPRLELLVATIVPRYASHS
jgi:hypothetical protein